MAVPSKPRHEQLPLATDKSSSGIVQCTCQGQIGTAEEDVYGQGQGYVQCPSLLIADLFYDGFNNQQQIQKTYESYFHRNSKEGLRDIVAQGVGMFALLRSGDQRRIDLSELAHAEFSNEGPTPCFGVVITTREGKTNTHGKIQYATFMRNANVLTCPVFFLSIYLFSR